MRLFFMKGNVMKRMESAAFRLMKRSIAAAVFILSATRIEAQVSALPVALDDFDFPSSGNRNDFFADRGPWTSNGGIVSYSIDSVAGWNHCLRLNYDVSAPGSAGGWWEHLAYSFPNAETSYYDLSRFETFVLSFRGEGEFTDRFYAEFIQGNFEKSVRIEVSNVTGTWQTRTIDLTTALKGFDLTRTMQFAIVLESSRVTGKKGALQFDHFAFMDRDDSAGTDDALLDLVSRRAFDYFGSRAHPATGLFQDRAWNVEVSSIASTGFGLAALGIGAERGWITRREAALRTEKVLTTLFRAPQGPDATGVAGYRGFYYHMLSLRTGLRAWDSELSSIDSAILFAGILFSAGYFDANEPVESSIRSLAESILGRVDWNYMLDAARKQFWMEWRPGRGYAAHWDYYTDEAVLVTLLAIASGDISTNVFYAWKREVGTYGGQAIVESWWGSLFTDFFAQCWFPFESIGRDSLGTDWFENSRRAALANRRFCIVHSAAYGTYGPESWGLTSCFGPGGYNGGKSPSYGSRPLGDPSPGLPNHDGTVAPYGAGSSIVFFSKNPSENFSVQALKNYCLRFPRLWGLYGLKDSYNLGASADSLDDWYADDYVGIDSGPMLLMIENYRSGLVWLSMTKNASVRNALCRIFESCGLEEEPARSPSGFRLMQNYPNPFNMETRIPYRVDRTGEVRLSLYDRSGGLVAELESGRREAGDYNVFFDGRGLPSGVYFVSMRFGSAGVTRKIALIK
jgi:hypothetical protein